MLHFAMNLLSVDCDRGIFILDVSLSSYKYVIL